LSTVSWTSATGGSWSTAADWSSGVVPQAGDDVVIHQTGGIHITLSGSASVDSLSVTGDTLTINGGTLSVAANSSIGASAVLTLNNSNFALALGATLTNSGSITVGLGSGMNLNGAYVETSTGKLTLPTGAVATGIGINLPGDPGFETPAADGSTTTEPDAWGYWGDSYVSTAYTHSGSQSLVEYGSNSGVYQQFNSSPGVSYSASVYALTPPGANLTGEQGAFMQIVFLDSNNNPISSPTAFIDVADANSPTGVWLNSTDTLVAPAGTVSVGLYLQAGPYTDSPGATGGEVYWDDVQFGPTAIKSANLTAASVTDSGTINIGAGDTITDAGSFTQNTTGILNIQLGGPAAGNDYGGINAGGAASLAGTLHVSLVNGYSPAINDGFTLLNYTSVSGGFSSSQLPSGSSCVFDSGLNPTYLGIAAVPPNITTSINAADSIGTSTNNLIGVNLAFWDTQLTTDETQQMVEAAGFSLFRFPGGSASDDYHFNSQSNYGDWSENTIPMFAEFLSNVGGTGIVTVDYGSGSPQEAEAELAYLEGSTTDNTPIGNGLEWNDTTNQWMTINWQSVSYWANLRAAIPLAQDDGLNFMRIHQKAPFTGLNDWEIGNEEYGGWEIDHHGSAGPGGVSTGAQHDPATYAAFAAAFAGFVSADAKLPSVQIGIDSEDPTGFEDDNWTRNVVTDLYADGYVAGFISDHVYEQGPGTESDSFLLNDTVSDAGSLLDWSTRYTDYESMLQQVLGTNASSVKVMATEYNSNYGVEGKQMSSLVNGLFLADSAGSLVDSGYTGGLVWDLRNGWVTNGNNSPSLYGWREGGDEGILGDPNYTDLPDTGAYVPYPSYFGEQIASEIMQTGGTALSVVSNYSELTVYSVLEPDGHLDLMVINKSPEASLTSQFALSDFTPDGQAQVWQYGEAQDYAQSQSSTGASALAISNPTISLNGGNFNYSFPAYSMTVIDLSPELSVANAASATPNPVVGTTVALSALGMENGSDSGLTYTWSATGPGSVSYTGATNGTNAAKNLTANFSQAGVYNVQVTITDPGGQTISSSVQVTALPIFANQSGSKLTITLNNIGPIAITSSGSSITVTEAGYADSFSGISTIAVSGSTGSNVLNINSPLSTTTTFSNNGSTTLNVNAGTLTIAAGSGSSINLQQFSAVNIAAGASLALSQPTTHAGRTLLETQSLSIAGSSGSWTGTLDLNGNDLEVQNGNLGTITNQVAQGYNAAAGGNWQGSGGVVSSAAASDTTHLTALGVILNTVDGTPTGAALYGSGMLFDGTAPPSTAVLIKYTYYGDANLDGKVDGTDYGRLDNGFLFVRTGWFNGDFNYDGLLNGSDYTLLDNSFNNQGAALNAEVAGEVVSAAGASRRRPVTLAESQYANPPAGVASSSLETETPGVSWIDELMDESQSG
jgi:alpha-L-arabinofuranosidase